jgi:hypothetical protein
MNPDAPGGSGGTNPLAALRRFARPRAARDQCELCDAELAPDHAHLVEVSGRRLTCACDACAILLSGQGTAKYRRVPRRAELLADFCLDDVAWAGLHLPINLAFFLHSTPAGRVVALYPSPAGATESLVTLEAWQALVVANPVLRGFEQDVEALLVNRVGGASECYRVGIDECYRLVGLIRTHWRGLSGGTEVWKEIGNFFAGLKERTGARGVQPMPDLSFQVEGAQPERFAAAPLLLFKLRVSEAVPAGAGPTPVSAVALRCQVRIEPGRRRYGPAEQGRLLDLFGTPERWGQTLRPLLWTHVSAVVPPFAGTGAVDLAVPCSYDFSLAATKYFAALEQSDIPLCFLFSGTIFYEAAEGGLQVAQIPWEKEAYFRLPAATWQALMDAYYPNTAWLCLRRDVFDRLAEYRSRRGLATWEQALERLLSVAEGRG